MREDHLRHLLAGIEKQYISLGYDIVTLEPILAFAHPEEFFIHITNYGGYSRFYLAISAREHLATHSDSLLLLNLQNKIDITATIQEYIIKNFICSPLSYLSP